MEELDERVGFLEREMRRHSDIIDGIDKRTDTRLRDINRHLDSQDKQLEAFRTSVDQRFEHVYGQLADMNANISEIRNILAALVAKLEK